MWSKLREILPYGHHKVLPTLEKLGIFHRSVPSGRSWLRLPMRASSSRILVSCCCSDDDNWLIVVSKRSAFCRKSCAATTSCCSLLSRASMAVMQRFISPWSTLRIGSRELTLNSMALMRSEDAALPPCLIIQRLDQFRGVYSMDGSEFYNSGYFMARVNRPVETPDSTHNKQPSNQPKDKQTTTKAKIPIQKSKKHRSIPSHVTAYLSAKVILWM